MTPSGGRRAVARTRRGLSWKAWASRPRRAPPRDRQALLAEPDHPRRRRQQERRQVHPAPDGPAAGRAGDAPQRRRDRRRGDGRRREVRRGRSGDVRNRMSVPSLAMSRTDRRRRRTGHDPVDLGPVGVGRVVVHLARDGNLQRAVDDPSIVSVAIPGRVVGWTIAGSPTLRPPAHDSTHKSSLVPRGPPQTTSASSRGHARGTVRCSAADRATATPCRPGDRGGRQLPRGATGCGAGAGPHDHPASPDRRRLIR